MLTPLQEQELSRLQLDRVMSDFQHLRSQATQTRQELVQMRRFALQALARALADRMPGQGQRQQRISLIASTIAREAGLAADECSEIALIAPLYNIGLLSMCDESLNTPESVPFALREQIQRGIALVGQDSAVQRLTCDVIRHYREHWDGSGMPDGLSGQRIPLAARIVAVAEGFDRLLNGRSLTARHQARQTFRQLGGSCFDPALVEAALLAEVRIETVTEYIRHRGNPDQSMPELELMSVLM